MARGESKKSEGSPTPDVYVALLFVSFAALVTCCVVLFLQLKNYGLFG